MDEDGSSHPPAEPGAFDTGAAQSGWPCATGGRFALAPRKRRGTHPNSIHDLTRRGHRSMGTSQPAP